VRPLSYFKHFVKIFGVTLDVPVFFVDFDNVAELKFHFIKVFIAQRTTIHYLVTSLSLE